MIKSLESAWKEYKDQFSRVLLGSDSKTKPWMLDREIQIIEEVLRKLKPKKCLEWGSGYSTLFFPKRVRGITKWISIDHDKDWFTKIYEQNDSSNIELYHVPPNNFPWTDENNDGSVSDLRDYIDFPERFGKFDFILVDGRARKQCLIKAREIINDKGIVVLIITNRLNFISIRSCLEMGGRKVVYLLEAMN
jgi:hypothetical protein